MLENYEVEHIREITEDLTRMLNIKNYPIKMLELLETHYKNKVIIGSMPIESEDANADVVSNYEATLDKCVMIINQHRIQPNLMKRLNFSLAHELGHLVLNHWAKFEMFKKIDSEDYGYYLTLMDSMTEEEFYYFIWLSGNRQKLEQEADEFAGQFLAPLKLIARYSPRTETTLSDYFFVSTKVIRIRFETLERLKPLKLPPIKKTKEQLISEFYDIAKNKQYNTKRDI